MMMMLTATHSSVDTADDDRVKSMIVETSSRLDRLRLFHSTVTRHRHVQHTVLPSSQQTTCSRVDVQTHAKLRAVVLTVN